MFLALDDVRGARRTASAACPALEQCRRIAPPGKTTGQCTEHATVLALFATAAGLRARRRRQP
ncbi:MAG: hypothetical protein KIT58_03770 [Planctomycetota bacterium]|nr:hypothetical protein [Planctomycetota bacterium]